MTLRRLFKFWLYSSCPFFRGSFLYFGDRVYFPPKSHLFLEACRQGIFEKEIVEVIESLITPGSYYFDVGGNIGLMAIPFLSRIPTCNVVTFEPSPNSVPYLNRTLQHSIYRDRWQIIPKAVSDYIGTSPFSVSPEAMSAFDGLKDTARGGASISVQVQVTTLDYEWNKLGCPDVSVIKCDVEGGELKIFEGAKECIRANRPIIVTEWNLANLAAHKCPPRALFDLCNSISYQIYTLPKFDIISNTIQLELKLRHVTENFILVPLDN